MKFLLGEVNPKRHQLYLVGIELLRYTKIYDRCNETFNQRFSVIQLLLIARAHKECDWDFYPDEWSERQILECLKYGKIPEWDEDEEPLYETIPPGQLEILIDENPSHIQSPVQDIFE